MVSSRKCQGAAEVPLALGGLPRYTTLRAEKYRLRLHINARRIQSSGTRRLSSALHEQLDIDIV